ncbi:uncharacterized protein F5891DRAFT_1004958 [Suillus fuscotomentosus]|uniref:DUF7330 domain-containing protein n=1 Tax=Suillus fuscotomentosus TaxID=1912939 RepID=A0AAD4HQF6_9AGAM|nr:uncharacterized protein F5891DRAFT_1004958 [Suillus fuscotomentosus]KAG1906300.1 hypothetical protein F5891DRAFT_1004958 [Suillus fuscotomentosus]
MIIPEKQPQNEYAEVEEAGKDQTEAANNAMDDAPPPSYSTHVQHTSSSGSTVFQPPSKPTNFLSLILKDKPIRGCYVIDPQMEIPLNLLPPLVTGETDQERKNLYLRTKDGRVVGRTTLSLSSDDGSITAKINTVKVVAPFLLDIYSRDGRVTVLLPRSFHGSLLLTTRHSTKLSDDLLQQSTMLSTVEHTRRYFVGDVSHRVFGNDWNGDELKVVSRDGRIIIRYKDEAELPKIGFFSRIFSS